MQLPLENVVSTVFDGNDNSRMRSDFQLELHRIFGGSLLFPYVVVQVLYLFFLLFFFFTFYFLCY